MIVLQWLWYLALDQCKVWWGSCRCPKTNASLMALWMVWSQAHMVCMFMNLGTSLSPVTGDPSIILWGRGQWLGRGGHHFSQCQNLHFCFCITQLWGPLQPWWELPWGPTRPVQGKLLQLCILTSPCRSPWWGLTWNIVYSSGSYSSKGTLNSGEEGDAIMTAGLECLPCQSSLKHLGFFF